MYLDEQEAEGLRRMAARTGKSQAELIRGGVRRILARSVRRKFHSLGMGEGTGEARPRWRADAVYKKALGKR